jgi:cell division control protein 6
MMPREKTLEPRILSFLKKTDIIFEPYDALDLLSILQLRAEKALRIDRVDQAALKKVAAYASRETGDARKAVELLAKAVRVAEETSGHLGEMEVDIAESRLEVDKTIELINALATQQRLALQKQIPRRWGLSRFPRIPRCETNLSFSAADARAILMRNHNPGS